MTIVEIPDGYGEMRKFVDVSEVQALEAESQNYKDLSQQWRRVAEEDLIEFARLRKSLRDITAQCGIPDALEALRIVLRTAQQALEAQL